MVSKLKDTASPRLLVGLARSGREGLGRALLVGCFSYSNQLGTNFW
jgi:hypothetical protein